MNEANNLKSIIERQKEIIKELELEYHILENSDLGKENDALRDELEKARLELDSLNMTVTQMNHENSSLKNTLYEQLYNEKIKILNSSRNKLDVYFKSVYEGELNRLSALEQTVCSRIDSMAAALKDNRVTLKDDVYCQINDLSILVNKKITEARADANKNTGLFSQNQQEEFEQLKNQQITERMVKEASKKNNIESFVGLNLINKLGIFLIIIGVIVAGQYTFFRVPDLLKGIMMFALGTVMLFAGELLNRKKPTIFSLGLTAGGVAVLYVSLATSYFALNILDQYPAIVLCILITAAAFVLATRYHAQIILAFALVGGYLPMFSISSEGVIIYGAMVYFVALNLLALLISFQKKWTITAYVGLCLNIIGSIYIVAQSYGNSKYITILYVLFAFLVYTLIPMISNYKAKLSFKNADIVLLGINTFFSSVIMYLLFFLYDLADYDGILAITFAAIYLILGWFLEKKFASEKSTRNLFYLTGFVFVVLVIPFQFGTAWLSLGWLIEGVVLTIYGIVKNEKVFKKIGLVICGLCLFAFIAVDLLLTGYLFAYKYLAITLGSLGILAAYIYKKTLSGTFEKVYTYVVYVNLWFYSIFVIFVKLNQVIRFDTFNSAYICGALAIAAAFSLAYIVPRIPILCDNVIKIISMTIYAINILFLILLNTFASPVKYGFSGEPFLYIALGTIILISISLLSVFVLYDFMKYFVVERKLGVEWLALMISAYGIIILTQNLIAQYHLQFSSAVISIIYVVTALIWIMFGFAKRYAFLRRFGLALSVLAVIKLFLIDLYGLTKGYQIISYFVLGITLLTISFVYQYFNKRLELSIHAKEDK